MKTQLVLILLSMIATLTIAADLPTFRSLHQMCSQNLVCSDGLYCRKDPNEVYGTCEDPAHV